MVAASFVVTFKISRKNTAKLESQPLIHTMCI